MRSSTSARLAIALVRAPAPSLKTRPEQRSSHSSAYDSNPDSFTCNRTPNSVCTEYYSASPESVLREVRRRAKVLNRWFHVQGDPPHASHQRSSWLIRGLIVTEEILDCHYGVGLPVFWAAHRDEDALSGSWHKSDFRQRCSRYRLLFRQVVELDESLVIILSSHFSTSNPFCACHANDARDELSVIHPDDLCFEHNREISCA